MEKRIAAGIIVLALALAVLTPSVAYAKIDHCCRVVFAIIDLGGIGVAAVLLMGSLKYRMFSSLKIFFGAFLVYQVISLLSTLELADPLTLEAVGYVVLVAGAALSLPSFREATKKM